MVVRQKNHWLFTLVVITLHWIGGESADTVYAGYWALSTTAVQDSWSGIATSSNGQRVYAIRSVNGGIYYSTNYGLNFFLSTAPYKVYQSITCSATGSLIAAIANHATNSLVMSTNFGATWTEYNKIENCFCWQSIAMSPTGNYMIAVGTGIGVYYSSNFGSTWTETVNVNLELNWTSIKVANGGNTLATTVNSGLWYSNNGGESWGQCFTLPTAGWTGVALSADGKTWLAVNNLILGGVYSGYNSGCINFIQFPSVPALYFTDIAISNTTTDLMISSNIDSYSYYSNNSGNTWNPTKNSPICSDIASSGTGNPVFATDKTNGIFYFVPNSDAPTTTPSSIPTGNPTSPTNLPSNVPTGISSPPTFFPSHFPSVSPSYSPSHHPSNSPTSMPSNSPTRPIVCPKGTYEEPFSTSKNLTCIKCPSGTYSTTKNATNSNVCDDCPYPTTTVDNGSSECNAISLQTNPLILYTLGISSVFFFILLIGTTSQQYYLPIFIVLIVPLFDIMTDLLYFLTSKFYNNGLFITSALILFYPFILFSYRFISLGAFPLYALRQMFWLSYSTTSIELTKQSSNHEDLVTINTLESPLSLHHGNKEGDHVWYPTIYSKRFSILIHLTSHTTIFHLLFELINWIIALLLQVLTLLLVPSWLFLWYLFGVYLEATKLIHLTSIWNLWFHIWTNSRDYQDVGDGIVDTHCLNYAILIEFFIETLPQLIIQGINNTLVGSWTSHYIGIISFIISCLMAFNVAYRYLYHSKLQSIPITMKDIPIHSILFKLQGGFVDTTNGSSSSSSSPQSPSSGNSNQSMLRPYTKQIQKKRREEKEKEERGEGGEERGKRGGEGGQVNN